MYLHLEMLTKYKCVQYNFIYAIIHFSHRKSLLHICIETKSNVSVTSYWLTDHSFHRLAAMLCLCLQMSCHMFSPKDSQSPCILPFINSVFQQRRFPRPGIYWNPKLIPYWNSDMAQLSTPSHTYLVRELTVIKKAVLLRRGFNIALSWGWPLQLFQMWITWAHHFC